MKCSICGYTELYDLAFRKQVRGTGCGSLERTRMLLLEIEALVADGAIVRETRVLHIAPEQGFVQRLWQIPTPENYVTADFVPELCTELSPHARKIDLAQLENWPSEDYALIVHSSVLEHIASTLAYPCFHLYRMLRLYGRRILVVPFMAGRYEESSAVLPDAGWARCSGQKGHVRRRGNAEVPLHLGSILGMPEARDVIARCGADTLIAVKSAWHNWYGFTGASVINLRRSDMKLIG